MSKPIKWHSGPPPSLGWWPASVMRDSHCYRWWNGVCWSIGVFANADAKKAARIARIPFGVEGSANVKWRDRPDDWPERSMT